MFHATVSVFGIGPECNPRSSSKGARPWKRAPEMKSPAPPRGTSGVRASQTIPRKGSAHRAVWEGQPSDRSIPRAWPGIRLFSAAKQFVNRHHRDGTIGRREWPTPAAILWSVNGSFHKISVNSCNSCKASRSPCADTLKPFRGGLGTRRGCGSCRGKPGGRR